jgi:hypothetical protein
MSKLSEMLNAQMLLMARQKIAIALVLEVQGAVATSVANHEAAQMAHHEAAQILEVQGAVATSVANHEAAATAMI